MTFFLLCGDTYNRKRGVPMRIDWNKKYLTIAVCGFGGDRLHYVLFLHTKFGVDFQQN